MGIALRANQSDLEISRDTVRDGSIQGSDAGSAVIAVEVGDGDEEANDVWKRVAFETWAIREENRRDPLRHGPHEAPGEAQDTS